MSSTRSRPRPGPAGAEQRPPSEPDQRTLRPDPAVRTLAEFLAFLDEVEAVAGRMDSSRKPTRGATFRL
jgi:hypothetical protein